MFKLQQADFFEARGSSCFIKGSASGVCCQLIGGVCLWEVSTYGRCLLMGGVHLWEVSTYRRCLLMGGVHSMGGVHLWEVSTCRS